MSNKKSS